MPTMYAAVGPSLILGGLLALGLVPAFAQTRWEDVLPQVKQRCANQWPDDYSMQAFCMKQQRKGWEDVNSIDTPSAGTGAASNAPPAVGTVPARPFAAGMDSEASLAAIVGKYVSLYNSAPNDMIKGGLRPDRGREICRLLATPNVNNWRGTVYSLSSNSDGNGVLEIDLGGDVYVRTMNNDFSDMEYHTLIPHGTPLFADASMLRTGQAIEFSGSLFRDNIDCFKETSLTVDGAMRSPEFLIRLSSLKHQDDAVAVLPAATATQAPWTGEALATALGGPQAATVANPAAPPPVSAPANTSASGFVVPAVNRFS